jgi:phosphoadenosine phosphosulfate reductase
MPPMDSQSYIVELPLPATANGNGNGNGNGHAPGADVEPLQAEDAITWAFERFGDDLRVAVSFQKTSSVIIDMIQRLGLPARFFYVDTGLLFPETYATRDALAERYKLDFERFGQQNGHGDANLLPLDQDGCCADRKVELMRRALSDVSCWVSGIRRVDSETRAEAPKFGWDERFGLWKLNPLADWDEKRLWTYIKDHHVPYNPLHDRGYPSIGCMPCTSVAPIGGDERAGRWAGTDRTECGIHG